MTAIENKLGRRVMVGSGLRHFVDDGLLYIILLTFV